MHGTCFLENIVVGLPESEDHSDVEVPFFEDGGNGSQLSESDSEDGSQGSRPSGGRPTSSYEQLSNRSKRRASRRYFNGTSCLVLFVIFVSKHLLICINLFISLKSRYTMPLFFRERHNEEKSALLNTAIPA